MNEKKKVVFSGIQPSGSPTIANYIGALKNYVSLQDEYDCYYSIVDMHAITVRQNPAELRKNTRSLMALLVACGLDTDKCTLYVQSHVAAHAQLCWILNCYTYMGEASRMIQFKEKSKIHESNVNVGLFDYPILQVADILLFQANLVPIGEDQRQHLELTRDIAIRFNNAYSPTFEIPEMLIPKIGARVMSLSEPTKKMSKSAEDPNSFIMMLDTPDVITRKIKRAVTDSDNLIAFDPENKPGVSNLLSIYCVTTDKSIEQAIKDFENISGYGIFKQAVVDSVIATLEPIQSEYKKLIDDKNYIDELMAKGTYKADKVTRKTLTKVMKKVGMVERPRV
jgi:tryptophanyl-tRNA synthetase